MTEFTFEVHKVSRKKKEKILAELRQLLSEEIKKLMTENIAGEFNSQISEKSFLF